MEQLTISMWSLVLLVFVALAFDFMNGFHDGANSISTIVATGALTPKQAVLFAAFFNFAALWVFELKVAATIGKGTVDPSFVDYYVIFGALIGALAWNIITWYYGIPSSSSHALVGGLVGATVAKAASGAPIRGKSPGLFRRLGSVMRGGPSSPRSYRNNFRFRKRRNRRRGCPRRRRRSNGYFFASRRRPPR